MHRRRSGLAIATLLLAATACGTSPTPSSVATPGSSTPASTTGRVTPRPTGSTVVTPRPTRSAVVTPTPPATSPSGPDRRVYVLGDSVLLGTVQTLPAALRGWRVTMNCVGSRRLVQGITVLRAVRSKIGPVAVIDLGNDYIPGEDGSFGSQIDQAMRVLTGVRRVVWVTVAEKWPNRAGINKAIRAAAARWPTIRVADWAPVIAAHPGYAYDMLHLTPSGRIAMARLIAAAVGPPPT